MEISDFLLILDQRFGELGSPEDHTSRSCCPLGLVHGDPHDLNPDPAAVTAKTGLPLEYCMGVAEAWDNAPGCFHAHSWSQDRRASYYRGFRDGGTARHRWLKAHSKISPVEKPAT